MATGADSSTEAEIANSAGATASGGLSFFGSVLTDRFSDASDVDILVEFEPDCRVGYFGLAAMERDLSAWSAARSICELRMNSAGTFERMVLKACAGSYVRE